MKKTINILAEGDFTLPKGTDCRKYLRGKFLTSWKCSENLKVYGDSITTYEVDFSEVPTLYPTKGMDVPEDGIELYNEDGGIIDSGHNGFTWKDYCDEIKHIKWHDGIREHMQLKRALPKTITVCSGCFKETCECVHADGWYRVKIDLRWELLYWGGNLFRTCKIKGDTGNSYWSLDNAQEVDWENPINVIPVETED